MRSLVTPTLVLQKWNTATNKKHLNKYTAWAHLLVPPSLEWALHLEGWMSSIMHSGDKAQGGSRVARVSSSLEASTNNRASGQPAPGARVMFHFSSPWNSPASLSPKCLVCNGDCSWDQGGSLNLYSGPSAVLTWPFHYRSLVIEICLGSLFGSQRLYVTLRRSFLWLLKVEKGRDLGEHRVPMDL